MTDRDLEQKLKELAAATAPPPSLATRVMGRVSQAHPPRRRNVFRFLPASVGWRAAAAVVVIAAGVAVVAVGLHSSRDPHPPAPIVEDQVEPVDPAGVRVLDLRRIDLKSPVALDNLLRGGSPVASDDSVVRVADRSRSDLNLY